MAKALNEVGRSLNCRVHVSKITWCSDKGSVTADTLSKADLPLFRSIIPEYNKLMREVPKEMDVRPRGGHGTGPQYFV